MRLFGAQRVGALGEAELVRRVIMVRTFLGFSTHVGGTLLLLRGVRLGWPVVPPTCESASEGGN
jgi:hypothetical protein